MSDLFTRILQALLPTGRAFRLWVGSQLRQYIEGLSGFLADIRQHIDLIWLDTQPSSTRALDEWEAQFGLPNGAGMATPDRIERLNGEWAATGGQSPRYIQDVLQAAGFDVYVHEWWVPGSSPIETRDPNAYVTEAAGTWRYGIAGARCGVAAVRCEDFDVYRTDPYILTTRGPDAYTPPAPPTDSTKWPFVLYISSADIGIEAEIPAARRLEWERLVRMITPAQHWLGIIAIYT